MLVTDGTKYYFCVVDGDFYIFYGETAPATVTIKDENGNVLANTTVYINGTARTTNANGVISFNVDSSNNALTLSKLSNSEKTYAVLNPQSVNCTAKVICYCTVRFAIGKKTRGTISFSDGTSVSLDKYSSTKTDSTTVTKPIGTTYTVTAGYNYPNAGHINIDNISQSNSASASGTLLKSVCDISVKEGNSIGYSDYDNSCGCGNE